MVFSSAIFLIYFLPLFLIIYWSTPCKFKNYTALLASLFFYAWGAPKFIFVLLASVVIDYFLAKIIARVQEHKKQYLVLSLALNLGLLFYFKYANFFVENINEILSSVGMSGVHWTKLALPIGISFFTFQKISYIVDVYKAKHEPLKKLSDLALYIIMFPQLIAGPIVRYGEIKKQLLDRRTESNIDNKLQGFFRFSIGLAKKMLIANQMGELADMVFRLGPDTLTTGQAWLGSVAYAFQIYFDFSGYSDMAIGLGLMMGFRFPENFNMPYISKSITEFWRRWHITLSHWMRDYLYIPLGGNRVSTPRLYVNLSLVFLISGLWHGAAWTFVIWGIFHGTFLILDKLFLLKMYDRIGRPLSLIVTYITILVGWVIFRSENLVQAWNYIGTMFDFTQPNFAFTIMHGTFDYYIEERYVIILLLSFILCFAPIIKLVENCTSAFMQQTGTTTSLVLKSVCSCILLFVCITEVITTGVNPFIYFRF